MYYKDTLNKVHWLNSTEFEHLLPAGTIAITDAEADALTPKPSHNYPIIVRIAEIEATITNRRLREAALTPTGKAWLENADAQIAVLRAQLT